MTELGPAMSNLPPGVVPLTMPLEFECACGRHQVLDPEELRAMMRQRKFRCHRCGRRRPTSEIRGVGWAHSGRLVGRLVGICAACEPDLPASLYVSHTW